RTPAGAAVLRGVDDRRVAETLLSRGVVPADVLTGAVRELTQQILTGVFRWDELEYRFLDGESAAWPVPTNVVISFELIIRALRSMAGFDDITQAIVRQGGAGRLSAHLYPPLEQPSL